MASSQQSFNYLKVFTYIFIINYDKTILSAVCNCTWVGQCPSKFYMEKFLRFLPAFFSQIEHPLDGQPTASKLLAKQYIGLVTQQS